MLKAVARHTDQQWVLLYVQRWLQAPLQQQDGTLVARDRGTPQGSAISPVLANLYLHYAFDTWLARQFPVVTFERYCDDAVIHCGSEAQARQVRDALGQRLAAVGLELHRTRRASSTARTPTGVAIMRSRRSRCLGIRFVHGWPAPGGASSL